MKELKKKTVETVFREICQNDYVHLHLTESGEGEICASFDGLLKVDQAKIRKVNALGVLSVDSKHGNSFVKAGECVVKMKADSIPLDDEYEGQLSEICNGDKVIRLMPFQMKRVAILSMESTVFGRERQDAFTSTIITNLKEYGCEIVTHEILEDKTSLITEAVNRAVLANRVDLVLCTGGMSFGTGLRTPLAVKNTGARILCSGTSVLPGASFLLSYLGNVPVMGLPDCFLYAKRTIFDLVLPRVLARDSVSKRELATLGEGRQCRDCENCAYKNCEFRKWNCKNSCN